MKIGILDEDGSLLGQAFRMTNLSHEVHYAGPSGVGEGLVNCGKHTGWDVDYYITNSAKLLGFVEAKRKSGFPIFGGGKLDAALQKEEYVDLFLNSIELERTPFPWPKTDDVEVYIGGLFNGERFTYMFSFVPCKTFMDGERGKYVGSMGCTLWPYFYPNNLTRQTLFPAKEFLAKFDFHGMFVMGCMLGPYDISVFEVSTRTRPDVLDCICELMKVDLARALFNVAKGESNVVETTNAFAVSVHVTTPPFPEEGKEWRTLSFPSEAARHIWFKNACYAENAYLGAGHVLTVTAQDVFGPRHATKRAYRTVRGVEVDEASYRLDIGKGVMSRIMQLDEWGWI